MNKVNRKVLNMVYAAVFAAMIFALTRFIQIPVPGVPLLALTLAAVFWPLLLLVVLTVVVWVVCLSLVLGLLLPQPAIMLTLNSIARKNAKSFCIRMLLS